jgi:ADP-ribose pyrophosphatase YjhB (NUDIX family)
MNPRAISLGIIIKDEYILLEERNGEHSKGVGIYYRPIGGTIEFGEKSDDTLKREYLEELCVEIEIKGYISCLENIFRIEGNIGHEITQTYLVEFRDKSLYQKDIFKVIEGSKVSYAKWISIKEIFTGNKIVYPSGLVNLLKSELHFS